MNDAHDYPLDYSDHEARRLAEQGALLEDLTQDMLRRAATVQDAKQLASMFTTDGVFNRSTMLKIVVTVSAACFLVVLAHRAMADNKLSSGESDARQIEHGRYLVKISGCNDCHTAGYAAAGG